MASVIGSVSVRDVFYKMMLRADSKQKILFCTGALSACDIDVFWFICTLHTGTVF